MDLGNSGRGEREIEESVVNVGKRLRGMRKRMRVVGCEGGTGMFHFEDDG